MVPLHLSYPSCYLLLFTSSAWATPTSSPNGVAAIPPLSTEEVLAPLEFNSKEEYVPWSCFVFCNTCVSLFTLSKYFTQSFYLFLNHSSYSHQCSLSLIYHFIGIWNQVKDHPTWFMFWETCFLLKHTTAKGTAWSRDSFSHLFPTFQEEGFTFCMKMSSLAPMKTCMFSGLYWWNRIHLLWYPKKMKALDTRQNWEVASNNVNNKIFIMFIL